MKKDVYGMVAHFFSPSGRGAYGSLNQAAKRRQTIIPDLVTSHHPHDSIIQANGPQMWEVKRLHSDDVKARLQRAESNLNALNTVDLGPKRPFSVGECALWARLTGPQFFCCSGG